MNNIDMARFIGATPWFLDLKVTDKYPPHNIIVYCNEGIVRVTLAIAGFTRDDLWITVLGNRMTVTGHRGKSMTREEYLEDQTFRALYNKVRHNGIGFRDFTSEFVIGEDARIDKAVLHDGLLEIDLKMVVPDEETPKEIPIETLETMNDDGSYHVMTADGSNIIGW